jgi:hypothetical protein
LVLSGEGWSILKMEFDSNIIRAEIEKWRTASVETAEALYQKCVRQEITYTEAWNLLPGPAPNVYYPHCSTNAHIPEVDYQHLTTQQAKVMFQRKEEERRQEEFRMQKQLEVIRKTETEKPTELEREIDAARRAYDVAESNVRRDQARVDALEEQLRVYKNALETQRSLFTAAKEVKERVESTRESILANLKQTRKEAEEEYNRTRTALHSLVQTAQQRQEKDKLYVQMLYSRLAQTEQDSKEYHAKVAAEKHAQALKRLQQAKNQADLERRIEGEVQRRKENAEFERLVSIRMGQ